MTPTLRTTIGVKGSRPTVANLDCKDRVYLFGSVNVVSGRLTTNMIPLPRRKKDQTKKSQRSFSYHFAHHLKHIARSYPQDDYDEVFIVIDNASWHQGKLVNQVLKSNPHLKLHRLPSYSPQLNPIERFWKILRRRATHNRLFPSLKELMKALRDSLRYYQTVTSRIKSMLGNVWSYSTNSSIARLV